MVMFLIVIVILLTMSNIHLALRINRKEKNRVVTRRDDLVTLWGNSAILLWAITLFII